MADKEKKEDKTAAEASVPAKKRGIPLLFIILPIVGAIAGVGVTFALPKPHKESDAKQETPESYADFIIPELKANLARAGGLHYCGLDIHIRIKSRDISHVSARLGLPKDSSGGEHGGGKPKGVATLGDEFGAAVNDRVILLLNSKSIDDLEGREKKELLKREIKSELEPILFPEKDGEIEAVLFKNLMIQ
ncbi:MAG: flagellar basal body-associated FliL family protein [Planctomycetes bacterium]|nr:flagellar basal body-associated FliL family protein [Planctomycetota bacterium]